MIAFTQSFKKISLTFQIHALTDDLLVLDRLGSNQLFEEEDFKLPETEIRYNKKAVDEETSGRSGENESLPRELKVFRLNYFYPINH